MSQTTGRDPTLSTLSLKPLVETRLKPLIMCQIECAAAFLGVLGLFAKLDTRRLLAEEEE